MMVVSWKNFMELADRPERIPCKVQCIGKQADGITIAQQQCLRKFGIGPSGLKYKLQASVVIRIAIERANNKLATPGQLWALSKCGRKEIKSLTRSQAAEILDREYISRERG